MAQKMYSEIQLDLEIKGYIAALEKAKQANAKMKADYQKKIDGMNKKSGDLMATFKKMAGVIGIAFGTQQVIAFTKEAVTLAAKAEGITAAFEKLNSPGLLSNLQKATRGTVADIDLMAAAVKANNFKISLEALPKYFEFAQTRARATGESVDYLVESIVTGIGRKSALILDNLGISLNDINAELKVTPDYATAIGNIMAREMEKSGVAVETTMDSLEQLKASMTNLKVEFGDMFNDVFAKPLADSAKSIADVISGLSQLRKELDLGGVNKDVANQIRGNIAMAGGTPGGALMAILFGGRKAGKGEIIIEAGTPIIKAAPSKAADSTAGTPGVDNVFGDGYWEAQVKAAAEYEDVISRIAQDDVFGEGYWQAQVQAAADYEEMMSRVITQTTDYSAAIDQLSGIMGSLIRSSMEGWDNFGETFKNIFKDLMAKLLTLIATYTVLNLLGFRPAMSLGSFIQQGFGVVPSGAGGASSAIGGGMELKVKGTSLATASARGGNILFKNT